MYILFDNDNEVTDEIKDIMIKAANMLLDKEHIDSSRTEISVTFVDKDRIRTLNKLYRNNDNVTDVLSFPQFDDLNQLPRVGEISLGDVVICKDKIVEQAKEFGHSNLREMIYLFVHSILHLLGYDHMTDDEKREMRTMEEEVMEFLQIVR